MEEIGAANEVTQRLDNENEIKDLVRCITTIFETLDPPLTSKGCIFKMASMNHDDFVIEISVMLEKEETMTGDRFIQQVPYDLRRLSEDAFTPEVVSIGPFHHGHPRLQDMEDYKLIYFERLVERADISIGRLISFVEEAEPGVCHCYSETIKLTREELVKVILVDSCFLCELFWRFCYGEWSQDGDLPAKQRLFAIMNVDLILLESQLSFFVIEGLYNLAFASSMSTACLPSFLDLTFHYFSPYNKLKLAPKDVSNSQRHFANLVRTFHLPSLDRRPGRLEVEESVIHLPSATELAAAGVRFRKSTSPCLLDLRFTGRVLEIPEFIVEDRTETVFRNLVGLEQYLYPYDSYITDYLVVLDFPINTSKDVDILVQNGIMRHWLGESNSVADLFNSPCKNVLQMNFNSQYVSLCKDLNAFYTSPWNNMKSTLET